jgi:hypothetical protein
LQAIVPYSYLHRRAGAHGWQTRDTPFIIGKSELFCPDMSISVRGERLSHLPKGYFFKKVIEALADPWCAFRESREATSDTFIEQRSHAILLLLIDFQTYSCSLESLACQHTFADHYGQEMGSNYKDACICNNVCRSPTNPDGFILTAVAENGVSSHIILVRGATLVP